MAQKPPDEASLREAAINYLARFASTEAGLRQVLKRRIDRWARENPDSEVDLTKARASVPVVVARMVELGLLNDPAFAQSRAAGLALGGRSRRAITARLMAKGIGAGLAHQALPEDTDTEFVSALILARKRRIGPFRRTEPGDLVKEMGVLARAGFPRDIAARALAMDETEAAEAIAAARSGIV